MASWQVTIENAAGDAPCDARALERLLEVVGDEHTVGATDDGGVWGRMHLHAIDRGSAQTVAVRMWQQLLLQAGVRAGAVSSIEVEAAPGPD